MFCTGVHFMNFKRLLEVKIVSVSKVLYVHKVLTSYDAVLCQLHLMQLVFKDP